MKLLWLTNIMLPEFAEALGLKCNNQGGWLPSVVSALRQFAPSIELLVACAGDKFAAQKVDGVEYVQFKSKSKLAKSIRRYIDRNAPDIVHVHGTEGIWTRLPRNIFGKIPVVYSLQGVVSGCYPHYCGNLLPSETFSIKNLPNILLTRYFITRSARLWQTRLSITEKTAIEGANAILGRTEWDKAWTEYLNPTAKYFHVGEILRPPFYSGGRTEATVVPRTIYCGAAFGYPLKGGHWLLRAVAAIVRKYPDVKLRVANALNTVRPNNLFSFIKQGEYHRYLSRLIRELGLEDNIVLLPSLNAYEVANELKHAEVFCLPSLCENSPNSLGEAMLMGCPCIATDVGGIQTILKNGEHGILVPSGDPAIIAHEISRMFDNKALENKYATAGQKDAVSRYNPITVVNELLFAYRQIIRK